MESSGPPRDTAWAMSEENVEVVRQYVEGWPEAELPARVGANHN